MHYVRSTLLMMLLPAANNNNGGWKNAQEVLRPALHCDSNHTTNMTFPSKMET